MVLVNCTSTCPAELRGASFLDDGVTVCAAFSSTQQSIRSNQYNTRNSPHRGNNSRVLLDKQLNTPYLSSAVVVEAADPFGLEAARSTFAVGRVVDPCIAVGLGVGRSFGAGIEARLVGSILAPTY